jgi:hypothetical protein
MSQVETPNSITVNASGNSDSKDAYIHQLEVLLLTSVDWMKDQDILRFSRVSDVRAWANSKDANYSAQAVLNKIMSKRVCDLSELELETLKKNKRI